MARLHTRAELHEELGHVRALAIETVVTILVAVAAAELLIVGLHGLGGIALLLVTIGLLLRSALPLLTRATLHSAAVLRKEKHAQFTQDSAGNRRAP